MKVTKKLVALLLSALLVVAMASVAFAADSPTGTVAVTDANGNKIEVTATTAEGFTPITADVAAKLAGTNAADMNVVINGTYADIPSSFAGQALTFQNVGKAGAKAYAYHWTGSAWEFVTEVTIAADGSATVTFPNLSPIAIVTAAAANGGNSGNSGNNGNGGNASPNTGVSDFVIPAAALLVLAGFGIALVVKRENA